ncbi:GIY-YIG nuclease family protein [Rubrobacter marinus]|uniref:GIY-YIG nuclease family protein n=1 Tax=Rubrobacter marinus TaxID=2653852 RepID=UPI001A9F5D48|nr:GIY-YIG nuclease family protein [Rubrobacter marinus]
MDAFVRDRNDWELWNRWRPGRNRFNRQYIFSLIDFYLESDIWLFGGIYKVVSRSPDSYSHSYRVQLDRASARFVGRLKVHFKHPYRERSVKLENVYERMAVSELLREPYSGERFPGYENINHDFGLLETVFRSNRPDWKAALENVKGVYVIADKRNGRKYVGSAYGDFGIWARWGCYIGTGHGWNDELTKLIREEGIEYARKNFRLSLLEYRPTRTDDRVIIERENYWKEALLSRGPFGYNKN